MLWYMSQFPRKEIFKVEKDDSVETKEVVHKPYHLRVMFVSVSQAKTQMCLEMYQSLNIKGLNF